MTSQKNILRKEIRLQLDSYLGNPLEAQRYASAITDIFLSSNIYKDAQTLFAYAATPHELSTTEIIKSALRDGKRVALPRTNTERHEMDFHYIRADIPLNQQLVEGNYGIMEPRSELPIAEAESLPVRTVFLVPGIAFTTSGDRMGHGKGYYDRYLCRVFRGNNTIHLPIALLGFCLDFQILESIPVAEHDIALTHIITPSGIRACSV